MSFTRSSSDREANYDNIKLLSLSSRELQQLEHAVQCALMGSWRTCDKIDWNRIANNLIGTITCYIVRTHCMTRASDTKLRLDLNC